MQTLFRPNPNRTPPHRGESKREISPCWRPVGSALLCFLLSSPRLFIFQLLWLLFADRSGWFAEMEALGQSRSDGAATLYSMVELLVAESVMVTERFLLSLLLPVGLLSGETAPPRKESEAIYGMIRRGKHKAVPENTDDGESDEEEDDDEDEDGDEQEDDGGEDDVSGEDKDNDAYDDPQANGEGGSEDEDDDDDDDDDEEEDDDGDEDDEDEEDDEELQQPPSKKRK